MNICKGQATYRGITVLALYHFENIRDVHYSDSPAGLAALCYTWCFIHFNLMVKEKHTM